MKRLLLVSTILLLSQIALAQKTKLSGSVINKSTQLPLLGATVTTNGNAVKTDEKGQFSIEAQTGDDLSVSYVGMKTYTVKIKNGASLSIELEEGSSQLEQVVVVGYNTQRKVDLTGAVSVVRPDDVKNVPASNLVTALQGRVPGMFVEADGRPNGGQRTLVIRGFNTLGNTSPLFVIDGVPTINQTAFQSLDPNLIESIQVLKDATAASIYGSRASNGVVIVTTKEGRDKLQINFTSSYGKDLFANKMPVLDVYERGRALWQAAINDKINPAQNAALYTYESHLDANGVPVLDKVIPTEWIGGSPSLLTPGSNTDWQDVVFHSGTVINNEMNISYGNKVSRGLFGFGYLNNDGMMRYMGFKKYVGRVNTSFNLLNGKVQLGENLQLVYARNTPDRTDLGGSDMINLGRFEQPILPVYKTDGTFAGPIGAGFSDRNNPLHMLYIYRDNFDRTTNIFSNVFAEIRPIKNLLVRSNFGFEYQELYNNAIFPAFVTGFLSRSINSMSLTQGHQTNWVWSNTANYELTVHQHRINLLAGMEATKNFSTTFSATREGFAIEDFDYYQLSAGTGNQTVTGSSTGYQLLSFFGKINYSYSDKYLLALTIRRDGSSRFGSNNPYGVFPSISAGWRLNKEAFLANQRFISNLKIRGGWGRVGNQEIGNESAFGGYAPNYGTVLSSRYNTGTAYDLTGANGGTLASGFSQLRRGNPNLKWETTEEYNGGIDFGFFSERIVGSFDYFKRRTSDILITPPYAAVIGPNASQTQNGATVDNKGYEATLSYRDQTSHGLFYSVGVNVSGFRNKVIYLPATVVPGYPGNVEKTILGHSPNELFGYVVTGIFQSQDEVTNSATQPGKGVGRLRYADLNKDGVINALDQDWLGYSLPKAEYGLNAQIRFKNFDLALFGQGVYGRKVNNATVMASSDFLQPGMNMGRRVLEAWTPQNTSSTIPALSNANSNNETGFSTYFVESGDYFKLRSAELGYSLPKRMMDRVKIQNLRFFFIGTNIFTIFRKSGKGAFTGDDPSLPGNIYPQATNVTFGLNLSL
ncbi:MAG: SusC/RagA family TonB-linked outer membrane protein [Flavisolibacter sp.]